MNHSLPPSSISLPRLLLKALVLFLLLDLVFAAISPVPLLGRISAYNWLFPGRERLPYGDKPELAYNLSLFNLDAMFASHALAGGAKSPDEYRLILIGDSSVWGFLLKPDETLAASINVENLVTPDGRRVKAYNLGYPTMSLTKDLLLLSRALDYQPDMVIWLFTLESFPNGKQLQSPIVQHNPDALRELISRYALGVDPRDPAFVNPSYLDRTIIGQRRELADIIRLQLYGVLWAATGIDQYYPQTYDAPQENLAAEESFQSLQPPTLNPADLELETLTAAAEMTRDIPMLFVNEPVYISHGENSDIRYDFYYPRWAYDQYRQLLAGFFQEHGWQFLDSWDLVPPSEFTNSAIHLTPLGEQMLAAQISFQVVNLIEKQSHAP